ncbi:hypothetical protein HC752_06610 [Vibrio sp. S9_S30]|uniref:hypothetical protein n=1 Tax=Vibrio sp. S9_S30 TaxID=2720226 RepID=UPI001680874A|nr:hypothetical protein [Vibrio sp. S9_S30]MBD1556604.1 hypothetical protein [Vibrio sp. S9_S30]
MGSQWVCLLIYHALLLIFDLVRQDLQINASPENQAGLTETGILRRLGYKISPSGAVFISIEWTI